MDRNILKKIIEWHNKKDKKPLILKGARQVGKTWLMKHLGNNFYEDYFYFNFDKNINLSNIFETNKDPKKIIELMSILKNKKIKPKKHLIIFDEIQESPNALNSLKYFREEAPEFDIICAGSLLGTLLAQDYSYPVGQVEIINVYPLSFDEFLKNSDKELYNYYNQISKNTYIEDIFHEKLLDKYNYYLIIGGMPEAVNSWLKYKNIEKVETIQKNIIEVYKNDFSKHNGKVNSSRILMVFESIVSQLAKENKKFIYGLVRSGARAREYEEAIQWLKSAGIIYKINTVNKPNYPISAYDKNNFFKIYLFDVGLLKSMAGIDNESLLIKTDFSFKGQLCENFILQQIIDTFNVQPRYYYENNIMEIDFLIQHKSNIIPIEVKAERNVRSKSLFKYGKKFKPIYNIRYSKKKYSKNGNTINIPIYLASRTKELI